MNRAAEKRADLKVTDWSSERVKAEEDRFFVGFNVGSSSDILRQSDDGLGFSVVAGAPLAADGEVTPTDTPHPLATPARRPRQRPNDDTWGI